MTEGPGFFISPEGEVTLLKTTHIRAVIKSPEVFGLSRNYIESIYIKHGEKTAIEGKAREEILSRVLRNGWIRIRRHHNRYWSVQTGRVRRKGSSTGGPEKSWLESTAIQRPIPTCRSRLKVWKMVLEKRPRLDNWLKLRRQDRVFSFCHACAHRFG